MRIKETFSKMSICAITMTGLILPHSAFAATTTAVSYEVEAESPSETNLPWSPQMSAFARWEITRQKSEVSSYVASLKDQGVGYLKPKMIKEMKMRFPALKISNKACNFSFQFFDFASWSRPTCEYKYLDAKQYLGAAMKDFLNRNPGYNPTEDRLDVIYPLEEVAVNHWDYKIQNGWFSCPKQIAMGTSAGFRMESESSPTVRGLKVTVSQTNKWQFSVQVLARDLKALAAIAKVSRKATPYGIEFNN